jgi:hypothetical protein
LLVGHTNSSQLVHKTCMKSKFMFLSIVIPDPYNLVRNIDIYLQLFIDKLN